MLKDDFTKVWKVEKSDHLRFSPGTCLIIENRYNIVTQNVCLTILVGLSAFSFSIGYLHLVFCVLATY